MIRSMTGFGKAIIEKNLRKYQVEIKSVNHRYLDISVKMPRAISFLEEEVKKEISKSVKRGKVDVFITFENNSLEGRTIKINTELAKEYIKELKNLAKEENLLEDIQVNDIAKKPEKHKNHYICCEYYGFILYFVFFFFFTFFFKELILRQLLRGFLLFLFQPYQPLYLQ